MKIISYSKNKQDNIRLGLVINDIAVDVEYALRKFGRIDENNNFPNSLLSVLKKWDEYSVLLTKLNDTLKKESLTDLSYNDQNIVYNLNEIQIHSPLPEPNSFRDFYAFEQHVKTARAGRNLEMIPEWYEFPVFYFSNHSTFIGNNQVLDYPKNTNELDFELEVACVIGKEGKNIKLDEAHKYIAGYSILNDWSARDLQRQEMRVGLGPAKGKDFATGMGPCLVTPDEIAHLKKNKGYDLKMTARKNGKIISAGNWLDIYYSFEEMIVRASENVTLYPGDVIGSGTVGSGCILELKPENTKGWLKSGDEIELEIEKLGVLKNRIV